jgi:hypothetical protein
MANSLLIPFIYNDLVSHKLCWPGQFPKWGAKTGGRRAAQNCREAIMKARKTGARKSSNPHENLWSHFSVLIESEPGPRFLF